MTSVSRNVLNFAPVTSDRRICDIDIRARHAWPSSSHAHVAALVFLSLLGVFVSRRNRDERDVWISHIQ